MSRAAMAKALSRQKLPKALELSGYRVGLYTSPHLFSFRERITVNGRMISEEEVVLGMQKIYSSMNGAQCDIF